MPAMFSKPSIPKPPAQPQPQDPAVQAEAQQAQARQGAASTLLTGYGGLKPSQRTGTLTKKVLGGPPGP